MGEKGDERGGSVGAHNYNPGTWVAAHLQGVNLLFLVLLSLLLFMLCWRRRRLDIVVRGTWTGFCHSYGGRRRGLKEKRGGSANLVKKLRAVKSKLNDLTRL